jgi:hypothetical protein
MNEKENKKEGKKGRETEKMTRLNKKYNSKQIIKLAKEGKISVKPNNALDTHGTSGSGLVMRKGLTIKNVETQEEKYYQIVFSARGSYGGTITSDLTEYNGRMLEKHYKYKVAVNDWFNDFLNKLGWFDRFLSNLGL